MWQDLSKLYFEALFLKVLPLEKEFLALVENFIISMHSDSLKQFGKKKL